LSQVLYRAAARKAARKATRATFFGYLEVREAVLAGRLTPSGQATPATFPWPDKPAHWRFSVVPARPFLQQAAQVDDIPTERASPVQRRVRGEQLDALFKVLTPETLDLFPRADSRRPEFATAYRLGGWFLLVVRDDVVALDEAPGLIGDGEAADRMVSLAWLQRVSAEQKRILRKVFSLAHVAGIDEGPDGEVVGGVTPPLLDGPKVEGEGAPRRQRLKVVRFEPGQAPIAKHHVYDEGIAEGEGDDDQDLQLVKT